MRAAEFADHRRDRRAASPVDFWSSATAVDRSCRSMPLDRLRSGSRRRLQPGSPIASPSARRRPHLRQLDQRHAGEQSDAETGRAAEWPSQLSVCAGTGIGERPAGGRRLRAGRFLASERLPLRRGASRGLVADSRSVRRLLSPGQAASPLDDALDELRRSADAEIARLLGHQAERHHARLGCSPRAGESPSAPFSSSQRKSERDSALAPEQPVRRAPPCCIAAAGDVRRSLRRGQTWARSARRYIWRRNRRSRVLGLSSVTASALSASTAVVSSRPRMKGSASSLVELLPRTLRLAGDQAAVIALLGDDRHADRRAFVDRLQHKGRGSGSSRVELLARTTNRPPRHRGRRAAPAPAWSAACRSRSPRVGETALCV